MKEGLIKITDTDNLYYDSTTKQYKLKVYCPYCEKHSGCFCYDDLETALWAMDDAGMYCSDRHFVLDTDDVSEFASVLGITVKPTMEEWNASKIVKLFLENFDGDFVMGQPCSV